MYKRFSAIMFPILLVALIGTGVWGYRENQEKNSILIKAENQYQRAFHDLSFNVDKLQTELGNTLAVNRASNGLFKKNLANVWRLTSQAQSDINQLPLTLLPFNKTEEFLAHMSNFAFQTSVRDLSKEPLTDDEKKTLSVLYDRSKEINNSLREVQGKVLANNLRWMDVEVALASENNKLDNTIIDGFRMVDKKVSGYPEINWGPAAESMNTVRNFQALSGSEASMEEIKQKAAQFIGMDDPGRLAVVENGTGTDFNTYSVSGKKPDTGHEVHMDFTKKGGQLYWYMSPRDVTSKVLDERGARDAAAQFLDEHGYKDMTAVSYDEYQNVASITMAARENNVIVYPKKIIVRVALDNGEVIGLQAADYIHENREQPIPEPGMKLEEARKMLNPDFKLTSQNLAVIKNDLKKNTLCYQFNGSLNGNQYRIYINANTGQEEKIETVKPGENQTGG